MLIVKFAGTFEFRLAPIGCAYRLRAAIVSHKDGRLVERLHVNEEREILTFVSGYMSAYHGLRKLIMTPYPFPLLQMTRWFLFIWVFTLPFTLSRDIDESLQVVGIVLSSRMVSEVHSRAWFTIHLSTSLILCRQWRLIRKCIKLHITRRISWP